MIKTAEINRPALQLTGYLEHFANERVQIIGYVEYTYLMQLNEEERRFKYERFISSKIPCVIFSTMTRPSQDMIDLAVKYNVPTFVTERTTSSFMAEIIRWLGVQLAPCISIHGVLVDVYGEGILITGESGIGKSEAALELIKRGHRIIADDAVEIKETNHGTLVASAPELIRHYMELRGIGVIDVRRLFGMGALEESMTVSVTSFGFKYGIPIDADLVFDVRFLPNPFYVEKLRPMSGMDAEVQEYVLRSDVAKNFLSKLTDMVDFLLPQYAAEGRYALTIGIGCTGGQHRSVAVAKVLTDYLAARDANVRLRNRDFPKT